MWKPRPDKWLLWAVPMVVLTTLPAYMFNSGPLNRDISARATGQLIAIGATWAVASVDGRDLTLGGDAPSQEAIASAVEALRGVYGVRRVATGARVVALPPVALVAPTVDSQLTNSAPLEITGTWQEGVAKSLAVTLAGRTYTFGTDPELTSSAGRWLLKPSAPLADGSYEVTAAVSDGVNPAIGNSVPAKLTIDTVAPPAPAITPIASGIRWPFTLNGTWAEGEANSLVARVADQTWRLGQDQDLKSDGKGNWSFAPVVDLAPGTYDITVEAADQAGNAAKSTLAAAIVIAPPVTPAEVAIPAPIVQAPAVPAPPEVPAVVPEAAPPPPQPAAAPELPPYDCVAALAEVSTAFPIRFDFNGTQLKPPLDLAMNQYAGLLRDPRCAGLKAEVAGHADFFGPRLYNQALSEIRAQTVVKALAAAGVDAARLATKGFSELAPADAEKSIAARKKNRRVEITLLK